MGRHPDLPAEFTSDLRSIFDNAVEGIYRVDSTGRVVMANQALARMLGYDTPEDMLYGIADVAREVYVEPEERKRYRALLKQHGTVTGFETRWRRTDGAVIWVAMSGRMLLDSAGERYHLGSAIDITERKLAEHAIRESEARFRGLTELSSDFYWETDAEHRVSRVTHGGRHRTILGGSLIGRRRWELDSTHPEQSAWVAHRAAMEAHDPFRDFEFGRLDPDGVERHLSISGEPMLDEAGRFVGYRGIGKDITLRKREERLLTLEHAVARTLSASASVAQAFDEVLGAICRSEGWDCARYFALDRAAGVLRCEHAWSSGAPAIERFVEASRSVVTSCGVGLTGLAWQAQEAIWVADVTDDPRFRLQELARLGGLRGAFVVPVTCQAGVMGVLSFMSGRVREPDRRLLQSMQIIASQVGQFLQRKDAEARRAKHLGYQETLARFAAAALGKRAADELVAEATSTTHDALEGTMGVELATQAACAVVAIARGDAGALGRVLEKSGGALSEEECKFLDAAASVLSAGLRRIESESRLAFLAQFDALTGLPNRALLADRFAQMIVQARRRASLLGVLFIDLDHFKLVNDSLGHAGGDALLKEVAARLQGCVRAGDTVARISGDEFAVLLADLARAEDAALVAQKILDRLAEPVAVAGKETFVSASIGIAAFPADGADAETLLRAADAAMYRAKQAGRNAYQFFTPEIDQRTRARAQLGSELRRALERNEFELAYQPKISLRTGEACGAEALLRWRRPDGEVVSPAQFIPVLEETGLIVAVGEWVLTRACADLKAWQAAGLRVVPIAVNLSARQFRQSDLEARIRSIIEAAGVAPGLLELEITESQLMQDPEHAVRVLEALHAAGIGIAIDDFGTGYSSLSYLTRFPVSSLKIDRSFVADVLSDRADATIVRTVVDMAHSLGVTVVAEGVETEAQAAFLSALGCEQAQGFLFARPMPAAALAERIAARK